MRLSTKLRRKLHDTSLTSRTVIIAELNIDAHDHLQKLQSTMLENANSYVNQTVSCVELYAIPNKAK